MRIFTTIAGLRAYLDPQRRDCAIGLVPTMGALHQGHASLIRRAIAENDTVIVTIFVNPLQFAPNEDLKKYPRQLEADSQLCQNLGVAAIFAPSVAEMGIQSQESDTTTVLPPASMTSGLCGAFREGHFAGVATIVTKLLNIVQPTIAYFGEKDAQQLAIIRRLVADFNLPVEIRGCPIVREPSGLAYSSRNQYLTPVEKEKVLVLSRSLKKVQKAFERGERDSNKLIELAKEELALVPEFQVQYVELVDRKSLMPLETVDRTGLCAIAGYLGSTRLIDNAILRFPRKPIIAIDGPAGAGKSTVTRRVAEALGLLYLDTGAMYRAIAWLVMDSGMAIEDEGAIAELVSQANIELIPAESAEKLMGVKVNGRDVTAAIRTPEVTANVSPISAQKAVRQALVKQQQRYGKEGGIVAEGRDIGTHVFPDAELKIFLTASPQERARRRLQDLKRQGREEIDLDRLEKEIEQRDYQDSHRRIAPLKKAVDAIEVNTDGLTIEEVTQKIIDLFDRKTEFSSTDFGER